MRPEYFKICIYMYIYLNNKILSLLFRAGHEGGYIAEKIRYVIFSAMVATFITRIHHQKIFYCIFTSVLNCVTN